MRRLIRFSFGSLVGVGALAGYLQFVGLDSVLSRATAVAPWAAVAVAVLVVIEAVVDGIGVWASVRPLGSGLSWPESVQFALAGDFFDTLSPAGPVSSEPIVARFLSVETETGYSEALGVRSVAKYAKSGTQLVVSAAVGLTLALDGSAPTQLLLTLGGAAVGLLVVGVLLLRSRTLLSRGIVAVLTPILSTASALTGLGEYDRTTVAAAVERFWDRVLVFGDRPRLLGLIAVAGVTEQVVTATALWVALAGTGSTVALLPIVVVIPLPQVASVVPIPGSVGAYDVLLSGALVTVVATPAAAAAAAVLVVRTTTLPFALVSGGVAVGFLRGWRPRGE